VISLVAILIVFAGVLGTSVMGGVLFWLTSRLRRLESGRESGRESDDTGLLTSAVDSLTAELSTVRDQLDMLEQRTEFNQRLLEGRPPSPPPATEE
jgi:hypothetical protein